MAGWNLSPNMEQVDYEMFMISTRRLVMGILAAWSGLAAQGLEGTFRDGICKVEGQLPGGPGVRVLVELGPERRPTEAEAKAMGGERLKGLLEPGSAIRPVKTFQVSIDGVEVTLAPNRYADLHNVVGVQVWKERKGINCMIQGKDGSAGYQATYTFVPARKGWAQASRRFKRQGSLKVEARQSEVQGAIETEEVQ